MATDRKYRSRRRREKKPVTLKTFASVGWVAAEAWRRTCEEIAAKIAAHGPWASARIKPLNGRENVER